MHHQRVYVYSKHTCRRCKSTSSEKQKCTRGVLHIYPFTPHGYLPTLLQAIYSPEGSKESISLFTLFCQLPKTTWTQCPIRKCGSRDQSLEGGRSLRRYRLKHSCRSTFDLTRFLLMTPYCACPSQKWGGSSGKTKICSVVEDHFSPTKLASRYWRNGM